MRDQITVALAGNPNCGKTSIFNNLTGARQHVGNWPGVTVEKKEGHFEYNGADINVVDLPGTYSLTAFSLDEVVARDFVVKEHPDVVVNIVDASNLERNLYLTVQLLETGANMIVVLNMMDSVEAMGLKLDLTLLEELLGIPVIPAVAVKGRGMDELGQAAIDISKGKYKRKEVAVYYGKEVEDAVAKLSAMITANGALGEYRARWLALKLLENDSVLEAVVGEESGGKEILAAAARFSDRIGGLIGDTAEMIIADRRYGFISGLCKEVVTHTAVDRRSMSDKADIVLAHKYFGFPIFLFLMWLTFQITFVAGAPPMRWLDSLTSFLAGAAGAHISNDLMRSLVVDGIIEGVGGVISFLPNILLLFFSISILEDSGYMARAAFLVDRIMHKIGLHGKSFIPMIVGFGCNVPAIMATRMLENEKDRIVTILVIPLMSCGARLPVYVLLAGAFFPENVAGNVIFSVYIIGIAIAMLVSKILRRYIFPGPLTPFVMELPPYRFPTLKSIIIHLWERAWMYLKKAGTIILAISVALWILMTFPATFPGRDKLEADLKNEKAAFEYLQASHPYTNYGSVAIPRIKSEIARARLENSYGGRIGKMLEPVFRPLGFDWKVSMSIIPAFAAKEVVVSTLGTIYSIGEHSGSGSLAERMRKDPGFNPLKAYTFMLFILLTVPCTATVAMVRRETNSWKWALFSVGYQFALSWIVCFIVYQGGKALGIGG